MDGDRLHSAGGSRTGTAPEQREVTLMAGRPGGFPVGEVRPPCGGGVPTCRRNRTRGIREVHDRKASVSI